MWNAMKYVVIIRGKSIKVFFSGDYEFETRSFGISGASGMSKTLNSLNLHTYLHCIYRKSLLFVVSHQKCRPEDSSADSRPSYSQNSCNSLK